MLTDPPPALEGVPADLGGVIAQCLARSPQQRYPTADAPEPALAGCGGNSWSHGRAEAWWRDQGGSTEAADGLVDATRSYGRFTCTPVPYSGVKSLARAAEL